MDNDNIVFVDGVGVHLDGIGAILFRIDFFYGDRRKFPGFARRHESTTQFIGEDGATDETARFYSHHFGDTFVAVKVGEFFGAEM